MINSTLAIDSSKFLLIILFSFCFPGLQVISLDKLTGTEEELQLYENTYSLIIGIDNYPNLGHNQQLQYAVSDAKAVAKSIRVNFQFNEVTTLYNERATKTNVQQAISNFRKTSEQDGVFIFFAGHGYTESTQDGDLGYILPNDGSMNELEMFKNISMNELKDYLKPIDAKHVFVVVDACYSGTLLNTRSAQAEPETDLAYLKEISRGRVRQVLTAGGKNQEVLDGGPRGHSVFTGYFLKYLENSSTFITASQLGYKVPPKVYSVANERGHTQVPQFGNLLGEGDFVFISSKTASQLEKDPVIESDIANTEKAVHDIQEALKKLGVNIKSEEIAKISGKVENKIKDKIEENLILNCAFSKSQTRYFGDLSDDESEQPFDGDINAAGTRFGYTITINNWLRYNRSEGLYFQINRVFQSPIIPGSSFYGGIGRAFHRNQYQYILGLEQLMFNNIFQFYAETFNKSITNDAWRLWDGENTLSTVFRRKDYLDWYNGQGYRAASFIHLKNYVSIGAEYNQIIQSKINNILEGDKFSDAYHVQEGNNIYLKTIVSIGYPVALSIQDKFQMYATIIRTSSIDNVDMHYSYDHLYFNLLIPYAEKLNFNLKVMCGASDVESSIWETEGYHQHVFEIGGEGTLRGYRWKDFQSSHYQLTTLETWFGSVGIFYDRAILFESSGNIFNATFFNDLSDNLYQDVKSSIGFILGRKNLRLSFAKPMSDDNNTTMYLTFGTPLQYW